MNRTRLQIFLKIKHLVIDKEEELKLNNPRLFWASDSADDSVQHSVCIMNVSICKPQEFCLQVILKVGRIRSQLTLQGISLSILSHFALHHCDLSLL